MLTPKAKAAIIAVVVIVVVVGVALGAFFGTKSSKSSKPGPMFPPYVPNSGGSGSGSHYHSGSHVPGSVSVSTGSFGSSGSSFGSFGSSFGSFGSSGSSGSAGGDSNTFNVNGEQMVPLGAEWSPGNSELNIPPGSVTKGAASLNAISLPWSATFVAQLVGTLDLSTPTSLQLGFATSPTMYGDPSSVNDAQYGITWNIRRQTISPSQNQNAGSIPYTNNFLHVNIAIDASGNVTMIDQTNTVFPAQFLPQLPQSGSGFYFVINAVISGQAAGIDIQIS
jgi:hypothetical protein